jgi:hypothetical protein
MEQKKVDELQRAISSFEVKLADSDRETILTKE